MTPNVDDAAATKQTGSDEVSFTEYVRVSDRAECGGGVPVTRNLSDGFSKAEKANLRRKCRNNFKIEDGVLHYRKNGGSEKEEDHWRICIRSVEEKGRILESCHSGVAGMISCQMYIRCSYIMILHVMQSIPFVFHLY